MRRGPAAWCAAVLLLVVGAVAACAPEEIGRVDPEITVSQSGSGAPTLVYVTPLNVERTYRRTVWPGTGPTIQDGDPLLLRFWVEDGTTAGVVTENFSSTPVPQVFTRADLGDDLYETLVGQNVGARLLQVTPPGEAPEDAYPAVTVVDVLPTRATGTTVVPRGDLPTVRLETDGAPSMYATGAEPPTTLTIQPLVRGSGRQIEADDVVTVQYAGFSWTTGEVFDSTWDRGQPSSFALSDVPAIQEGLVEQTTGSQVMLVVPPSYDLGATQSEALAGQTLVFVIDILASGPQGVTR